MTQHPGTSQSYSVAEAAAHLGVSTTTIRRMVKRGQLEGERVLRPQGSAFLVTIPGESGDAAGEAAPTQQGRGGVARGNAAGMEQLAAWSETFLVPLVAALERQVERVTTLERENGRQAAELEAARAQISTLLASTATSAPGPTSEPFWSRGPRGWGAVAATVLAIVVMAVVLGWPR